jgi:hypothetical protein
MRVVKETLGSAAEWVERWKVKGESNGASNEHEQRRDEQRVEENWEEEGRSYQRGGGCEEQDGALYKEK